MVIDDKSLRYALVEAIVTSEKISDVDLAELLSEEVDENTDLVLEDPLPDMDDPVFPVFAIMDHNGQPDLTTLGFQEMKIWYEGSLFDDKHTKNSDPDEASDASLEKIVRAARNAPKISVVDIERWWGINGAATSPKNVDRYTEAMRLYQEQLPAGHKAGLYSTIPIRHYFAPVRGGSRLASWQISNDALAPIAQHVDFTCPSLYTFYDLSDASNLENWMTYARAQINEAKRIAPGKPCYPYLWPRYHGEKKAIEGRFWKMQLELCRDFADGVVIWDDVKSEQIDFEDLPDWWDVSKAFVNGLS